MYTNFCSEYLKGPRRKWYNIKIDVKEARHEDKKYWSNVADNTIYPKKL